MRRNFFIIAVMVVLTASVCAGCSNPESKEQAVITQQESLKIAEETPLMDSEEVANPIQDYESYEALQDAAGFAVLDLPKTFATKNKTYCMIGDTMAEIDQISADNHLITIRMQKGTEDITGYFGVSFEEQPLLGVTVHVGETEDDMVAWWTDGTYTFALILNGSTKESFYTMLEALVNESKTMKFGL